MRASRWPLSMMVAGAVFAAGASAQEKGGTDDFGPYDVVAGWSKATSDGFRPVGAYAVYAESPNRILATYVGELPVPPRAVGGGAAAPAPAPAVQRHMVVVYDGTGKVVDEWKQWDSLFLAPHFITESPYDPDKAVWIVDRDGSQIFKFSNDGTKLLMVLGEKRVDKADATHFGGCASIAFMPDGSFYVADGYRNRRVVKLDKNGKFLMEWGSAGSGPGQFAANGQVHSIAIDAQHRVYVGDRGNRRVQIFDENGKFLDEWDDIQGPSDIKIMADGTLWVTSGVGNRLAKYDIKTGKLLTYWGMFGAFPGAMDNPHFISVDSQGNLYVAISSNVKSGIEKYVPRANADKSRLIGQPLVVR